MRCPNCGEEDVLAIVYHDEKGEPIQEIDAFDDLDGGLIDPAGNPVISHHYCRNCDYGLCEVCG